MNDLRKDTIKDIFNDMMSMCSRNVKNWAYKEFAKIEFKDGYDDIIYYGNHHNVGGYYDPITNTISIKHCDFGTIAHELAHWLTYQRNGGPNSTLHDYYDYYDWCIDNMAMYGLTKLAICNHMGKNSSTDGYYLKNNAELVACCFDAYFNYARNNMYMQLVVEYFIDAGSFEKHVKALRIRKPKTIPNPYVQYSVACSIQKETIKADPRWWDRRYRINGKIRRA